MRRVRRTPSIDMLVLHYTELPLKESLDILRDGAREHRVSAHYVLAEDGTVHRLVPEDRVRLARRPLALARPRGA